MLKPCLRLAGWTGEAELEELVQSGAPGGVISAPPERQESFQVSEEML